MKDTVVVGLGNVLMSDEGIGPRIIERLLKDAQRYPSVEFVDLGTRSISLLHIISGRIKAVIIDCALMGTEAGTIKRFTPSEVSSVKQLVHYSLHEADILTILDMARRLEQSPEEVIIFGIEPQQLCAGRQLSPTLASRLDDYIRAIQLQLVD